MTDAVRLSRNEIESLAFKAARGAGLSWGMAEEAGFAAGWLHARGQQGAELLLAHLTGAEGKRWSDAAPQIEGRIWAAAADGPLCPLAAGAALCDATELPEGLIAGRVTLRNVAFPLLVLPFIAGVSARLGQPCLIEFLTGKVVLSGDEGMAITGPEGWQSITSDLVVSLCAPVPFAAPPSLQPETRAVCRGLEALALRTTVPPSAQSRAGAGAAKSDND